MQESQMVGCFKNCVSGLKRSELNDITNNIYKTLEHPSGKEMLYFYLNSQNQSDNIKCLELYDMCSQILQSDGKEQKLSLDTLINRVEVVRNNAVDVPPIDTNLMRCFNQALKSQGEQRKDLIDVLERTKDCCSGQLRSIHEDFQQYVTDNLATSCPGTS
ncbi:uncharacterized protein LOC108629672 [Ceratina calcarata]|uniref:Uncharacterized protein LOC108629672 n=1 Tax=Ceratina calcarata TaxID=156304 RepID=A0AAJ7J9B6_9HYME|nr:uncharacterized protein LOC108629672 [Ceratina calcarata]XP_017887985.1 uncharacterized protein LOC108629672 [Ceratina calcarata]XP_017887986.1 uncharacterized protein LOC108629672 [Ceratina calcarata]XP_026673272.1 uncharacterized protein LOC108629672 [Ceratina calcarata]